MFICLLFIFVYAPAVKTTKGKNEQVKFLKEFNECLVEFEEGWKAIVVGM